MFSGIIIGLIESESFLYQLLEIDVGIIEKTSPAFG